MLTFTFVLKDSLHTGHRALVCMSIIGRPKLEWQDHLRKDPARMRRTLYKNQRVRGGCRQQLGYYC